jgi:predicted metal-dependent HD superfamily phosphohydrolase
VTKVDVWRDFCRRLGAIAGVEAAFAALESIYRQPARVYHTLDHAFRCVAELRALPDAPPQALELEAALWYHDAIYDTHAQDNEERSAAWARTELGQLGADDGLLDQVSRLIIATKHTQPPGDLAEAMICDLDLAILGQERATVLDFERAIREEYRWVPVEIYRERRGAFLKDLLARETIYHTPVLQERYEQPARDNLNALISALQDASRRPG